jgi:Na+-transporting methylmalonyl-CoA/oxaloacetate decarboxylase gamma subunit
MSNLVLGLEIMAVGFSVVMITLFLLYLVLLVFGRCCAKPEKKQAMSENIADVSPDILNETTATPVAATLCRQSLGTAPEIVAVITAAISVCLITPASQFEIVSLQPARSCVDGAQWTIAGRKRLMEKRQDLAMFRRERRL